MNDVTTFKLGNIPACTSRLRAAETLAGGLTLPVGIGLDCDLRPVVIDSQENPDAPHEVTQPRLKKTDGDGFREVLCGNEDFVVAGLRRIGASGMLAHIQGKFLKDRKNNFLLLDRDFETVKSFNFGAAVNDFAVYEEKIYVLHGQSEIRRGGAVNVFNLNGELTDFWQGAELAGHGEPTAIGVSDFGVAVACGNDARQIVVLNHEYEVASVYADEKNESGHNEVADGNAICSILPLDGDRLLAAPGRKRGNLMLIDPIADRIVYVLLETVAGGEFGIDGLADVAVDAQNDVLWAVSFRHKSVSRYGLTDVLGTPG